MRHALYALLALTLLPACHMRFKRMAPTLGPVHPEVHQVVQPNVQLGMMYDGGLVGDVVNVVQAGRSYELSRKLAERVDTDSTSAELERGVIDTVGEGPPFAITEEKGGSTLQIEVVDMGMEVYGLGAPGVFDYDLRVRIYRHDGKLAYKSRVSCTTAAGAPDAVSAMLWTVDNARQLEQMSDEDLQGAFDAVAYFCGGELARKLRKHAG